ncbi:PDZ domain-containing protein [Fructilactobacillus florum]|uniref:PDZ domain-containing protein n=1 Tax=Fructilactobacillus florum TaxID=640331 RepID=UPI000ADE44BD|nr:PDZ domain-containing protein [Fructilactobacillus florum]
MKKISKQLQHYRILILLLAALSFLLWFFFWPLNTVVEAPGEAVNLQPMVKISGQPPLKKNQFMITAVSLSQARPVTYVQSWFNPHLTIENANNITGGQSGSQFNDVQNVYMESAINNAIYVAYQHANRPVQRSFHGVYVLNLLPNSDFRDKLEPADLIESINGKQLKQSTDYVKYIRSLPENAKLKIDFKRKGKPHTTTGFKREIAKGFNGIGITMTDDVSVKSNPAASIKPGEIGGPSGGLMFALQIYSQLEQKNISTTKKLQERERLLLMVKLVKLVGLTKKLLQPMIAVQKFSSART